MSTNDHGGGGDRQKVLMLVTAGLAGAVLIGMMVFVNGPAADLAQRPAPGAAGEQALLGERLYAATCSACHGNDGQGGVGPALDGSAGIARLRPEHLTELVQRGGERMPAAGAGWDETEIEAVSAHLERLRSQPGSGGAPADR